LAVIVGSSHAKIQNGFFARVVIAIKRKHKMKRRIARKITSRLFYSKLNWKKATVCRAAAGRLLDGREWNEMPEVAL
jgi:hypothetical protein